VSSELEDSGICEDDAVLELSCKDDCARELEELF
jgi:hypothetical protein